MNRHPQTLSELPAVFARLDAGESLALGPGNHPPKEDVSLGVRSSGTTGEPRVVWHPWTELLRTAVVRDDLRGWTWASPFRADSFAGVQVALQAWATGGRCVGLVGDWASTWQTLVEIQPEALCCTPTFLDVLILAEGDESRAASGWCPRQITLGGEPLRENAGRRVKERFPDSRFTVIYASAELGIIARTHRIDGWFDIAALKERWTDWRVQDGTLEVHDGSEWRSTQDAVEVRDPNFRVLGRATAVANVAGTKVALAEVEAAAEDVAGVQYACARAEPNPVTGQVVVLRFAPVPGTEPLALQAALEASLRSRLLKPAWPRRWECIAPATGRNAKKAG